MDSIRDKKSRHSRAGLFPEEWDTQILKDACSKIGSGITPRGGEKVYRTNGVALIRSQNVLNNRFVNDGLVFVDQAIAEEMENVEVEAQDVLLNITGDSVARCCTVPESILPARVNQHVSIIRTRRAQLDPTFLRYYLTSPRMQKQMHNLAESGGTRNALTKAMIEDFVIPKPDIREQEGIVAFLSSLDNKIAVNEQINKTLEAIAQALFKHWFVDFEFPNEEGEPYKSLGGQMKDSELAAIPGDWDVEPFSKVISVNPTRALATGTLAKKVAMTELNPWQSWIESWELDEYRSGPRFQNGDTLFARITPSLEHGKTALVSFLDKGEVAFGSTEFIVFSPKTALSEVYVFYLARSGNIRDAAINAMTGSSGRQRVPNDLFDHIRIVVPSQRTTERFQKTVAPFFERIRTNANQNRVLGQIRDSLLPKLMSGAIRVKPKEVVP